jgi:hypothetical protein
VANADLGIEALGVTDGGGNRANGNGNPLECVGVACTPAPQCQDGIDNDGDGRIDYDGGQSIYGSCAAGVCPLGVSDPNHDGFADSDYNCVGQPARNTERQQSCGLGAELALVMPLLGLAASRRRRTAN